LIRNAAARILTNAPLQTPKGHSDMNDIENNDAVGKDVIIRDLLANLQNAIRIIDRNDIIWFGESAAHAALATLEQPK
jgi:hypothetical protein